MNLGLHCLACINGASKQARHSIINGASIIPWKRGKIVTWDVTVADSFAASKIKETSLTAGAAAELAAMKKTAKYEELTELIFSCHLLERSLVSK